MSEQKILIVEDEQSIAEIIEFNLQKFGYVARHVETAEQALALLKKEQFDLILLDLMLGGMDGLEFCKIYRSEPSFKQVPIIMLTARTEEADIVSGLESGADDYITKPFSPRILVARVKAHLREFKDLKEKGDITDRGIDLNPKFHEAKINGELIDLTANEFSILYLFMENPGKVFSRDDIIQHLHGPGYSVTDRAIDVQIVGLRKKLGELCHLVETVRGVGYRFSK